MTPRQPESAGQALAPDAAASASAPAHRYRVLMIAPTSFFADYGCHVRILEEAQILQKLGQQVTIATYHNGGPVAGLDIRRSLPVPWRRNYEVGSSRHKIGLDVLLALKTFELMSLRHYDVIHAHLHEGALMGTVLSRFFHAPMVFDFQGSMTAEMIDHHFLSPASKVYRSLVALERRIDRAAPLIFTSTTHAGCVLQQQFGCDPERIRPLPDCVNADTFRPAASYAAEELDSLRGRLGIPAGRKLIVYLGLLAEYQGTGLLLEAMQRILAERDDVHLLLMGFPNVAIYQRRAADLGIAGHVTLTDRLPYAQAPLYLALGDVAAAPKLSLTEGSGKILNYMAVGLPVVAFDTPVAREYLGVDGILAARGDASSLAASLLDCLFPPASNPQMYARIGWRLRQRAQQLFSWEKTGRQILAAYQELLGDAPATLVPQGRLAVGSK